MSNIYKTANIYAFEVAKPVIWIAKYVNNRSYISNGFIGVSQRFYNTDP